MSAKRKNLVLGIILLLAAFLRIYKLDVVPIELFGDELDVGYHAYSLLKTGRDYTGHFLPTYISSLAEARAPLFIYSVIPFVAAFGLSEWGIRLSAVFFGLVGIFFIFFLSRSLFKIEILGLIASFFLAITPWHIHYSRAAYEVTLLLALFLGGSLFFLKGLKNPWFLLLSAILFALTPYVYSTANLFLPLLLLSLLLVFKREIFKIGKKWIVISIFTALIILLPLAGSLISGRAGERFSKISIFSDKKLVDEIILERNQEEDGGRIFHNKGTAWTKTFIANYLTSFSPQFLFLNGDPNPRHGIGKKGELYLVFLPFLLLGFFESLKNIKIKEYQFIISWLLISPIPSALTQGGGSQATRLFLMLPPVIILVSLGILQIIKVKKRGAKVVSIFIFCLFLLVEMSFYIHQYFVHWPRNSWPWWHYGYKEIMQEVYLREDNFQRLVFNNTHEPILLRFLFWTKKDPGWFQKNFTGDKEKERIFPDFLGFRVSDRYIFGRITAENKMNFLLNLLDKKTLYLAFQGDEIPGDWDWEKDPPKMVKVLRVVRDPLNNPYIYLLSGEK
jgi:4-amino-4-deoxy-L-arabinose transferase-like glycosyltransferase